MITLLFNETNKNWVNNKDHNFTFLLYTERYLEDLLYHRGYLYLNQVYEALGFEWNPKDENKCFIKPNCAFRLNFEIFEYGDNTVNILIHY